MNFSKSDGTNAEKRRRESNPDRVKAGHGKPYDAKNPDGRQAPAGIESPKEIAIRVSHHHDPPARILHESDREKARTN